VQQDVRLRDLPRQHHRVVQRQRVTKRAEADLPCPLGKRAKEGERVRVDGEFLEEGMFQAREDVVATPIRVLATGDDIPDQLRVIASGRALELAVGSETQGLVHLSSFLVATSRGGNDGPASSREEFDKIPSSSRRVLYTGLEARVNAASGAPSSCGRVR